MVTKLSPSQRVASGVKIERPATLVPKDTTTVAAPARVDQLEFARHPARLGSADSASASPLVGGTRALGWVEGKSADPQLSSLSELKHAFVERFGAGKLPLQYLSASGRINLLGEHTDYSDGFSLPAAIDKKIQGAFQPIGSEEPDAGKLLIQSLQFDQPIAVSMTDSTEFPPGDWRRYATSAVKIFGQYVAQTEGTKRPLVGMRGVIESDIPVGSGLSSSAALLLLLLDGMARANGLEIPEQTLALLARDAEWDYGVKCGVMDPFAIVYGKAGQVSLVDARSQTSTPTKINLPGYQFLIAFTKERSLEHTEFNQRRNETQEAAALLAKLSGKPIEALRDVDLPTFLTYQDQLPQPLRDRAEHVVRENARVQEAIPALSAGDVVRFAELMAETHSSLSKLYQASSPELDAMVEAAQQFGKESGVTIGARMMGGGWGGPALILVPDQQAEAAKKRIAEIYTEKTGEQGRYWDAKIEQGRRVYAGPDLLSMLPAALTEGIEALGPDVQEQLARLHPDVTLNWDQVDAEKLRRDGFGPEAMVALLIRQDARIRGVAIENPSPGGKIEPFTAANLTPMPKPGSPEHQELAQLGRQAREAGKVAYFALFGGRASRMKNFVKAIVNVVGDQTFLDIKQKQARASHLPFIIGTSPATDAEIKEHLLAKLAKEEGPAAAAQARAGLKDLPLERIGDTLVVRQGMAPAIDAATGRLKLFSTGKPYYYPGGHGAFLEAFHTTGMLDELKQRGVEVLMLGNGDNLGQDVDDAMIGLHLRSQKALTIEANRGKTSSGFVALRDGQPVVLELLPEHSPVEPEQLAFANTNSFLMTLDAIARAVVRPPERLVTKNPVDPGTGEKSAAVEQAERVTAEMTWLRDETGRPLLPAQVVEVEGVDQGEHWRFLPIKSWDDLRDNWRKIARRAGLPEIEPVFPEGI